MADCVSVIGTAVGLVGLGLRYTITSRAIWRQSTVERKISRRQLIITKSSMDYWSSSADPSRGSMPNTGPTRPRLRRASHLARAEVNGIKALLDELRGNQVDQSTVKGKMREQTRKMVYPFKRKKLAPARGKIDYIERGLDDLAASIGSVCQNTCPRNYSSSTLLLTPAFLFIFPFFFFF